MQDERQHTQFTRTLFEFDKMNSSYKNVLNSSLPESSGTHFLMNSEPYFAAVILQIRGSQGQSLQPIEAEDVKSSAFSGETYRMGIVRNMCHKFNSFCVRSAKAIIPIC